jgi:alcohol dehydrogenase
VEPGRILGHEAVGTIEETGAAVSTVQPGDRVLVSCISACGRCRYCRAAEDGQCLGGGGWILGHRIDGTRAEYVRVPFADTLATWPPGRTSRVHSSKVPGGRPPLSSHLLRAAR